MNILRSGWECDGDAQSIRLKMKTKAAFPGYAICLWAVPAPFTADLSRIKTNAKEVIPARNVQGEFHLILVFDLKPDVELTVSVR